MSAPTDVPGDDAFVSVHPALRRALVRRGFATLTRVQNAVLAAPPERNLRISSETGSGKTVAIGFLLAAPLIDALARNAAERRRGPLALLITPTRELAAQVREELSWLFADIDGVHVGVVTGGTDIFREKKMLARHPEILVGTPGRLLDHIRNASLSCAAIEHVVLDEADQMLDMGFREELEAIVESLPAERRSHLVSATFPHAVRRLADAFQHDALHVAGTELGSANRDIEHIAHVVHMSERYDALVNCLLDAQGERCLVFVKRRDDASEVAERLAENGFSAMPLSGDLAQAQRTRTLNAFRSGTVRTLVATDVAARGIDVADISTVIHFDPPLESATYTHRSGRTGRAGRKGQSIVLVPTSMQFRVRRLLRNTGIEAAWQPVPSPAKIKKAVLKRARKELHDALAQAPEPTEAEHDYVKKLLSDYDSAKLITQLLQLAEPKLPCEPFEVRELESRSSSAPARSSRGFARFSINWGEQAGATPGRLLAHVCRRGNIGSDNIGALDIGRHESTFEVGLAVAENFERAAAAPDRRDPHLQIRRAEGSSEPRDDDDRPHRSRRGRPDARRGQPFREHSHAGDRRPSRARRESPGRRRSSESDASDDRGGDERGSRRRR